MNFREESGAFQAGMAGGESEVRQQRARGPQNVAVSHCTTADGSQNQIGRSTFPVLFRNAKRNRTPPEL